MTQEKSIRGDQVTRTKIEHRKRKRGVRRYGRKEKKRNGIGGKGRNWNDLMFERERIKRMRMKWRKKWRWLERGYRKRLGEEKKEILERMSPNEIFWENCCYLIY